MWFDGKKRYTIQRKTPDPGHWVGVSWVSFDTLEEATVELSKLALTYGGRWRIKDRWNAVKEE
jgi:hypothetical protein